MATTEPNVLVGGVGQLYQGDLDLGRLAADTLRQAALGPGVRVEDLSYGALAVAQLLEEVRPGALVLIGAAERGRPPGSAHRRRVGPPTLSPHELQDAVHGAGTGYVGIDLVIEVGWALGALPRRTVAVEVEPAATEPAETLSPDAHRGLDEALALVREEVRRVPLLRLADRLRQRLADPAVDGRSQSDESTRATTALPTGGSATARRLLDALAVLDRHGRWADAFGLRDRLRLEVASSAVGDGMAGLDWALWWDLIEEMDRLQAVEAFAG